MNIIKTSKEKLLVPLQVISGFVEKKHSLPILSNVLIEKLNNILTFQATDIEIQITTKTEINNNEGETALTVNAKKFQDILKSLPENKEVNLTIEEKKLIIRAEKSKFTLQTLTANDFPKFSMSESAIKKITITQKNLKQLFSETKFGMAVQDVRYYLNGLLLILEGNELKAVSTDGHRLVYSLITLETNECFEKQEFVLPSKTVSELYKLLTDTNEMLQIDLSLNQIRFRFGVIDIISKLIDGKFPDYQRVIPNNFKNSFLLERNSFLQALQRVSILINEKFKGIRFILSKNLLKIISTNNEQEEAEEEIEVTYEGELIDIGFNINYLIDVLTNIQVEKFELCLNDSNSSVLFKLPNEDRFKYIVMPMRI